MPAWPPARRPASGYWPVDFAEASAGKLTLVGGASFGEELPIEWSTPAVAGIGGG